MRLKILHTLWRLCTFALVLILTFLTVEFFVPYLDRRLPLFPVILITYLLVAYVLIPLLTRFWRLVMQPTHIPRYVTTPDGWPADPVNIAIIAHSKRQLTKAMQTAGWHKADKATFKNMLREGYAILFNAPYNTAPFSKLYLFGRPFDIGFQKPRTPGGSPHSRHHVRFWRFDDKLQKGSHEHHFTYWRKYLLHLVGVKHQIWIGAAIDDTGPLGIRWRNFQLTHRNNPDTNQERDLIVANLEAQSLVKDISTIQAGEPFAFYGQTFGNHFKVDGQIKVVELKHPAVTALRYRNVKSTTSETLEQP